MPKKSCFDITVSLLCGQGQRSGSNFWCASVNIRGLGLLSAAKSNNPHYQSKVFVCVSVISGRIKDG